MIIAGTFIALLMIVSFDQIETGLVVASLGLIFSFFALSPLT
jgi:hypothetical protein